KASFAVIEDAPAALPVVRDGFLHLAPAFPPPRLVAREHRFAERILDAFQINFDGIADLDLGRPSRTCEFAQRDPAFGLQADIDDGHVLLDPDNRPFDDGSFLQMTIAKRFLDHAGEVFARRRGGRYLSHKYSEPRD